MHATSQTPPLPLLQTRYMAHTIYWTPPFLETTVLDCFGRLRLSRVSQLIVLSANGEETEVKASDSNHLEAI